MTLEACGSSPASPSSSNGAGEDLRRKEGKAPEGGQAQPVRGWKSGKFLWKLKMLLAANNKKLGFGAT